jgi:heparinase II/III-like protein
MSSHELKTRLGQEASKRWDLALYRAGLLSTANGWKELEGKTDARFFFTQDELPTISGILRETLPNEVTTIIAEADDVCRHKFRLLGYEGLAYGKEIDWHLDAVHGKRAALKPWFKIDFLDFDEVGDHKVTWELNRHQHLVTLAKAWCLTGDERYVAEIERQFYSWQAANPYPMGINWGSSLEVAFRSLSWLWVKFLLADCRSLTNNFDQDILEGLALNGRYIERYLSTYFSPNTHLLGEAVALFFIGTLFPQIPLAATWRDKGWQIVVQEADRQVRSDGVYFEQSLYYHVYALDFFLHARILAQRNRMHIPAGFDRTLNKMLDVISAVSQTGPATGFGDDDGGRVFNPRRNRAENLTDPLAIGAIVFGRNDFWHGTALTEEAAWLFGSKAIDLFQKSRFQNTTEDKHQLKSASFEAGGIYVMASAEPVPVQMVIDAGPQGIGHSGHGHADALSIQVSVDGRPFLIDPGAFCYMDEERDAFRGTGAHNTLSVDGSDQAVAEGPFAWSSLPEVRTEKWTTGRGFSLFVGSHNGYSRLQDPVVHRRVIFHLHGEFWLIRDLAEGYSVHQLQTSWHFASDVQLQRLDGAFIAEGLAANTDRKVQVKLLAVENPEWNAEISSEFVSPAYGRKISAPVVRIISNVQLPTEHAVLLQPFVGETNQRTVGGRLEQFHCDGAVNCYRYHDGNTTHWMTFTDARQPWTSGKWSSDAELFYLRIKDGEPDHFILCGASFLRIDQQDVWKHDRKLDTFEWDRRSGESKAFSSDDTAIKGFSPDVIRSGASVF